MKKIVSILLIALFFFNLVGYRLMFNYMQQQSDSQLEASLDKEDYNEADLVVIQFPLSLPYQNNQVSFERINGEITVKGKIYKYVKRKISNGNLVLLCLPDQNKMRIQSEKDNFFKYSNDLVQNNQSKKSGHAKDGVFKNLSVDYVLIEHPHPTIYNCLLYTYDFLRQLNYLPSAFHSSPEQPPDFS